MLTIAATFPQIFYGHHAFYTDGASRVHLSRRDISLTSIKIRCWEGNQRLQVIRLSDPSPVLWRWLWHYHAVCVLLKSGRSSVHCVWIQSRRVRENEWHAYLFKWFHLALKWSSSSILTYLGFPPKCWDEIQQLRHLALPRRDYS